MQAPKLDGSCTCGMALGGLRGGGGAQMTGSQRRQRMRSREAHNSWIRSRPAFFCSAMAQRRASDGLRSMPKAVYGLRALLKRPYMVGSCTCWEALHRHVEVGDDLSQVTCDLTEVSQQTPERAQKNALGNRQT